MHKIENISTENSNNRPTLHIKTDLLVHNEKLHNPRPSPSEREFPDPRDSGEK